MYITLTGLSLLAILVIIVIAYNLQSEAPSCFATLTTLIVMEGSFDLRYRAITFCVCPVGVNCKESYILISPSAQLTVDRAIQWSILYGQLVSFPFL